MSEYVVCQNCGYVYLIYPSIPASDDSCPKCGLSKYESIGLADNLFVKVKAWMLRRKWWEKRKKGVKRGE